MQHTAPELVTQELLDELHRISPYDPEHLPREIELMEAFRQRHPNLPQVACFDTAFRPDMPRSRTRRGEQKRRVLNESCRQCPDFAAGLRRSDAR